MSNEWNDIEKLFKSSLDDNPGGNPIDPWSGIEKRILRTNFFTFTASTFNVYYLSIAMVLTSTLGFAAYKAADYHWELKKKNEIIRQYQRKELEEKINIYIADSIKAQNTGNELSKTMQFNSFEKNNPKINISTKNTKTTSDTLKNMSNLRASVDTITRITVKKKVVRKQLFIKNAQQVKDSIVIK